MVDWLFARERIDFAVADEPDDGVADAQDEHDDADDPTDGRAEPEPADHLVDGEECEKHAQPDERLRVEQRFPVRCLRQISASLETK